MGMLIEGRWTKDDTPQHVRDGQTVRYESPFRNWISGYGADKPSAFRAEPGRYHLYAGPGCPWSHRAVLVRKLKGLEDAIAMSHTSPAMGPEGWWFGDTSGGASDPINDATHLHQIYARAKPDYTGRVTTPVLWDKQTKTIATNDSPALMRLFNSEFNAFAKHADLDFAPEARRAEIDALNLLIADRVNDGVYRCGLATTQETYGQAFDVLFATLDEFEARLSKQRFLLGRELMEPDLRLFPSLVRFDIAYYSMFRCNLRRIIDYPNLHAYTCDLYQTAGVAETVDLQLIKKTYYHSRSPNSIIPKGPALDFDATHNRAVL